MLGRSKQLKNIAICCAGIALACVHVAYAADNPREVTVHRKPHPLKPSAITRDWPCFLGPNHNGVCEETGLLKEWPKEGSPLVWEMTTGRGYAAPSVAKGKLVFVHRVEDEEIVECLHPETGERFWDARYPTTYRDRYGYGDGPRATPIIDEGRVFIYSALGHLRCYNLADGKLEWDRNLSKEFNVPQDFFGVGNSPLIEGDKIIVNVGAPGGPCVLAMDKATGETKWQAGDQWGPSYATPVPATIGGLRRIFVFAGGDSDPPTGGLLSIHADTGKVDFQFPFRSKLYESVNATTPVIVNDTVLLSTSYGTGSVLLRIKPQGDCDTVWKSNDLESHFATPIEREGFIYGITGRHRADASIVCLDAKTGKALWKKQPDWTETVIANNKPTEVAYSAFRGSLIWADGYFLCLGEVGHLAWLDLSPKAYRDVSRAWRFNKAYRELARAWLFNAEETWTPPVLSHGLLYVTQNRPDLLNHTPPRLLCYDLRR